MNFIFTACTTVCSPMGANFAALQKRLGDRSDVALVSISIDPSSDTPARLKAWSERFHARSGWTLLTGKRADVEHVLKALGVYTPNRFTHAPIALVGSDASGRWERVSGLLPPDEFVRLIEAVRPHSTREGSAK
jgi:protein SCO1/2